MSTDDRLCIPVDPHDYEHEDDKPPDEGFVSLAEARPERKESRLHLEERLLEWPGD